MGCCGPVVRIGASVDPDPCNALADGPAGLLVPSTTIEAGAGITVTPPDPDACPQAWQVAVDPDALPVAEHGWTTSAGLDLQSTAQSAFTNTSAQVTLPVAGTYHIDAQVRGWAQIGSPSEMYVLARLLNATTNAAVPNSVVKVLHASVPDSAAVGNSIWESTAPITVQYQVAAPTTIRLQGARQVLSGPVYQCGIASNTVGTTNLRFRRVA